jgi:hypothetical protein
VPDLFRSKNIKTGVERGPYKFLDIKTQKIVSTGTDDKELAEKWMSEHGFNSVSTTATFADLSTPDQLAPSSIPVSTPATSVSVSSPENTISVPPVLTTSKPSPVVLSSPTEDKNVPKPGQIRKNGLAELTPQRLRQLKDTISKLVASGNIDVLRMVFSLLGKDTRELDVDSQTLLAIGWEAQLEELFVNGLPPPWLIILVANVTLVAKLGVNSTDKKAPNDNMSNPKAQ